jgi:thioredoxin-related protein
MLAEMYRPPFEIMSRVDFEEGRQEGREQEKWLLVNIQDPAVFDCQLLNRDLWKDPQVRDTVKENFVFLQYNKEDTKAAQYLQYYFQAYDTQDSYPHISIVDPRTGEQVKAWTGPPVPKPAEFVMPL